MKYLASAVVATVVLGVAAALMPAWAAPADEKGKTCRMEQQCHWENFKKICVYVKVCR